MVTNNTSTIFTRVGDRMRGREKRALFWAFLIALAIYFTPQEVRAEPIETISTVDSTVTTKGDMNTTINQPPPSAISPQFSSGSNSDLCTVGVAGAVQTQILGISAGTTFTEENCVRLKKSKILFDLGMKVAAVSVMCQDKAVFDAMMHAGTPCPYDGKIGAEAKLAWETHTEYEKPYAEQEKDYEPKDMARDFGLSALGWLLLL